MKVFRVTGKNRKGESLACTHRAASVEFAAERHIARCTGMDYRTVAGRLTGELGENGEFVAQRFFSKLHRYLTYGPAFTVVAASRK